MDGIQHIGFSFAVISGKAIDMTAELQFDFGIIFEIEQR
jgi:hypothetical protein